MTKHVVAEEIGTADRAVEKHILDEIGCSL